MIDLIWMNTAVAAVDLTKASPELLGNSTYVMIVLVSLVAGGAVKLYDRWKKSADQGEEKLDSHIEARISELKDRVKTLETQNELLRKENKDLLLKMIKGGKNDQE